MTTPGDGAAVRFEVDMDSPVVYVLGREMHYGERAHSVIELTEAEHVEYLRAAREFWRWQERLAGA